MKQRVIALIPSMNNRFGYVYVTASYSDMTSLPQFPRTFLATFLAFSSIEIVNTKRSIFRSIYNQ